MLLLGLELFDGFGEDVAYEVRLLSCILCRGCLAACASKRISGRSVDRSNAAGEKDWWSSSDRRRIIHKTPHIRRFFAVRPPQIR